EYKGSSVGGIDGHGAAQNVDTLSGARDGGGTLESRRGGAGLEGVGVDELHEAGVRGRCRAGRDRRGVSREHLSVEGGDGGNGTARARGSAGCGEPAATDGSGGGGGNGREGLVENLIVDEEVLAVGPGGDWSEVALDGGTRGDDGTGGDEVVIGGA